MYDVEVLTIYVMKYYKCEEKLASTLIKSALANNDIIGLMNMVGYRKQRVEY